MNITLTAVNAKFIHSSLALRSIKACCGKHKESINIMEFTINNRPDYIAAELYAKEPGIIGFSCYIWNIEIIKQTAEIIRKILPNTIIIFGGPETAFTPEEALNEGIADIVVLGEGEDTFREILDVLTGYGTFQRRISDSKCIMFSLSDIKGIAFKENMPSSSRIITNKRASPVNLANTQFPYGDIHEGLDNRIVYYETSRGCPYSCRFCISATDKPVRFRPLNLVYNELDLFIENGIPLVKLVDRTFNCDKSRALKIWKHIIDKSAQLPEAKTCFHFEIRADLLDAESVETLRQAKPGLFQIETGLQSTNKNALYNVDRLSDIRKEMNNIIQLKDLGNMHIHVDLIAGLPGEGISEFKKSFNDAYSLYPDNLQMGFLKLLKGSGLRNNADKHGLIFTDRPPYEVLSTNDISYGELLELKGIEEVLEIFYNSGKFQNTLRYIEKFYNTAYDFYSLLGHYWTANGFHRLSHNKYELYAIMNNFCLTNTEISKNGNLLTDLLKYDLFVNGSEKSPPEWLAPPHSMEEKKKIDTFLRDEANIAKYLPQYIKYSAKEIKRMCRIEKFSVNIPCWRKNEIYSQIMDGYVIFNYAAGDLSHIGVNAKGISTQWVEL